MEYYNAGFGPQVVEKAIAQGRRAAGAQGHGAAEVAGGRGPSAYPEVLVPSRVTDPHEAALALASP